MPRVREEAVCLFEREWSETSQIACLFTRASGLVNGLAKGSRRGSSSFDGGIEPLTIGEVVFVPSRSRELLTLTEWSTLEALPRLRRDLPALAAASFAADATRALLAPFDPHPALYDRLRRCLATLADRDRSRARLPLEAALAAVGYVWDAVRDCGHGFEPPPDADLDRAETFGFDPEQGSFTASPAGERSAQTWAVRVGTLRLLSSESPESVRGDHAAGAARFLAAWIDYRVGKSLPSLRLLTRLMAESP